MTPIITTTSPQFIGSMGSLLPHQIKLKGDKCIIGAPPKVYIHGKLEWDMGYDLPIVLAGELDFTTGENIFVYFVDPNPESKLPIRKALMWPYKDDTWYITYPEEMEDKQE